MLLAALAVAACTSSGAPLGARDLSVDGLSLRLPEGWRAAGHSDSTAADAGSGIIAGATATAGRWLEAGDEGAGDFPANLVICRGGGLVPVSPAGTGRLRRRLEAAAAALPGVHAAQVRELAVVEAGGFPGYRLRLSLDATCGGRRLPLEQLIYVVGARGTPVLVFSAPRDRYAQVAPLFEAVVESLAPERGLLAAMPPWFCVALLGGLASFGAAARRSGAGTPPAPAPRSAGGALADHGREGNLEEER
jgi:hypothetical protein